MAAYKWKKTLYNKNAQEKTFDFVYSDFQKYS